MRQQLSDSIHDYRQFRVSQGKARATLSNDKQTLVAFLTSVGNIYTENVAEHHVTQFLADRTLHRAAGALGIDVTVLRCFFTWAARTRRMPRHSDPMAGRKAPTRAHRERDRVAMAKFPTLLDAAGSRTPRDRAFIAVALYTLARTSEIESMRVKDVDLDSGYIRAKIHKSNLEDRLPITAELDTELRRWLTYYTQTCGPLNPLWFLTPSRILITEKGVSGRDCATRLRPERKLTHVSSQVIKPALTKIGFVVEGQADLKGEGAHTIRRSGARALFDVLADRGYDGAIRLTQALLHHKNMAQTEAYIGITLDRQQRDELLRGKPMYGALDAVVPLKEVVNQ